MGSEGKSRKRRSSLSPPPSREEAEKVRKHRKREGEERRRNRDHDEDDDRKKKKTKSSDRSHKEKKSKEKHGKHRKKNSDSFVELSKDDYFSKNNEFSTWLKEEKGLYFSDLSSEQARDQFSGFMKDWNNHKLNSRYYEGIAIGPRTAHNWKIKKDN